MLLNRLYERVHQLPLRIRLLRRRARLVWQRTPVVLVPSILGTKLVDTRGRLVWGNIRRLYFGAPLGDGPGICTAGLLRGFSVVPGLLHYDVFGALVRFLVGVGGYVPGEDLHVLEYDWRGGIAEAGAQLAELLQRLRGAGEERFDLVGMSTGGLVIRWVLAQRDAPIRRVVYVGTPQEGAFSALWYIADGVRPAPLGKSFSGAIVARFQTVWDALPIAEEPIFVDEGGAPLDISLYDPDIWGRLQLDPGGVDVRRRLEEAARFQRAIAGATHPDSFVIGARNLVTATRCIVQGGRATFPPCEPRPDDARLRFAYEPGDSAVPERSVRAVPGLDPQRVWFVEPSQHRTLPADRDVHRLVLEALLATDRAVPETVLRTARTARLPLASGPRCQID
jgi:pimeloyl-ACP methyl ester carboxylesterase